MIKSQLKSGVVLSYVNLIIGNLIPFIYTPMMMNIIGESEYGLYTLSNTIVGYLSLLSFGMGSAVIRYITKYKTNGDNKKMQQMFGLFTFLYSILAIIVLILGVLISFNIGVFYSTALTLEELSKMRILIILCSVNCALTFVFTTYSSIVLVFERYIFRQLLNCIITVVTPCANIFVLLLGFSSIGMVLVATGLNIITFIVSVIYCSFNLKIRPMFRGMPFGELKSIFGFCFFVFLASIVDMLFWATDKVIIGASLGTVAVAVYNIGSTFNSIVTSFSSTISGVLTPRITNMVFGKATKAELTEVFIKVGRLQFFAVGLILSGFIVFGRQFIQIWVGPKFADSYYVALLTLIPVFVPLIQNIGISIVTAQKKHKFRSIIYLIIALANAVSTYFIVNVMGIIGAALCSAISYIIGQGFIMNWYYWKKVGIDIPLFWKNISKISIIPITMIGLGLIITNFFVLDTWVLFFLSVIIFSLIYLLFNWFFGMNNYEKNIFISPIKKIINKVKR